MYQQIQKKPSVSIPHPLVSPIGATQIIKHFNSPIAIGELYPPKC